MSKKKFSLSNDLIIENKENKTIQDPPTVISKPSQERIVSLTIKIPETTRKQMKSWCLDNNISLSKALLKGFEFYKKNKNI